MKWNKLEKPPTSICPREFCFLWSEEDEKCDGSFGECCRNANNTGARDLYEPCEPELEKCGLPWFYFIPDTSMLASGRKEDYLRETEQLWGRQRVSA
jgi:hypothetical protein